MIYQLEKLRPQLADSCYVAGNATVIGNLIAEEEVSIWFNVVIRADADQIRIGKCSNIQDGSILHVDPGFPMSIGEYVTVGHKVMLHGCSIGDNSLIGINAVVLNGAKIGKNCLIGANALITENMEIPDGHMALGSPAKVIKSLDENAVSMLRASALHYVENGKNYRQHLSPLSPD